jgi:hypothetical protein
MNANGIELTIRQTYAGASPSAANVGAMSIQIGKGLKGVTDSLYKTGSGRTASGEFDYYETSAGANSFGCIIHGYSEATGIYTIDLNWVSPTTTSHPILLSDVTSTITTINLVINASKNPALTGLNVAIPPTVQRFTSGSGLTYITPPNCRYIDIEMIGPGGGGGGSGTGGGTGGSAGGSTTFGASSLLVAPAGGGGVGGVNGTFGGFGGGNPTISSPAITIISQNGTAGSGTPNMSLSGVGGAGGMGGSGPYGGGAGGPTQSSSGHGAPANTGGGGSGAGGGSTVATSSGCGGGASGSYLKARINSPLASYSNVTVGVGGTAGTAGTSGQAGGAGGSGIIVVTEYY